MRMTSRAGVAAAASALLVLLVLLAPISETSRGAISNVGQLAAAVAATVGCLVARSRASGHRRTSWAWLAVGTGSWAAGQSVWSYAEIVLQQSAPFPSPADLGFLLFPVAGTISLLVLLGAQTDQLAARGRDLVDGAVIAGSLVLLSWITTLGAVAEAGSGSRLALVLGLAYPVGDIMLATLALIALTRSARVERQTLGLLVLGIVGLAVSDSLYVYVTTVDAFETVSAIPTGWVFGFLVVALAGFSVPRDQPAGSRETTPAVAVPSTMLIALPYVPVGIAGAAVLWRLLTGTDAPVVDVVLAAVLVTLVLARQFLAVLDNQRLVAALAEARDRLEQQTLHDPLTGLANRALLADRLGQALARPDADITVLYCDLDDFKIINDQHGHDVGDRFLQEVALRLSRCVRDGDTVARLGGDEFAVLLLACPRPAAIAERMVAAIADIAEVAGRPVRASISIGITRRPGANQPDPTDQVAGERRLVTPGHVGTAQDRDLAAVELLRSADAAMYVAKSAGKSRAVSADQPDDQPGDARDTGDTGPGPRSVVAPPPLSPVATS